MITMKDINETVVTNIILTPDAESIEITGKKWDIPFSFKYLLSAIPTLVHSLIESDEVQNSDLLNPLKDIYSRETEKWVLAALLIFKNQLKNPNITKNEVLTIYEFMAHWEEAIKEVAKTFPIDTKLLIEEFWNIRWFLKKYDHFFENIIH